MAVDEAAVDPTPTVKRIIGELVLQLAHEQAKNDALRAELAKVRAGSAAGDAA